MMTSVGSVATISSLWLAFLSTCCLAWPSPYRRAYQYYPPMMAELGPPNQWDIAQEPYSYEQPEDYFDNSQWTDIEALSNLIDMYDNAPAVPVWGQIVNEKPEEELIELKRRSGAPQQNNNYGQNNNQRLPQKFSSNNKVAGTFTSTPQVATSAPQLLLQYVTRQPLVAQPQVAFQNGQKEVPLLRPPVKPKATPSPEPAVISAQVTSQERQKKPSPYDTLRKYLSIEDALKKEAEKRRVDSRHQKRSNFIAEEGTLTGQLSNLKKNMA